MIKEQREFLQENLIKILEMVYQHETFTDLLKFCVDKICKEPEMLFNFDKFMNLRTPLLELLLRQDSLLEKNL